MKRLMWSSWPWRFGLFYRYCLGRSDLGHLVAHESRWLGLGPLFIRIKGHYA